MQFWWHLRRSLGDVHDGHESGQAIHTHTDIVINEKSVHVWLDLPDVLESDISIYRQGNYLAIEGVKISRYPEDQRKVFLRMERHSGSFRKLLNIPESENIENFQFELNNGVLHIVWQR